MVRPGVPSERPEEERKKEVGSSSGNKGGRSCVDIREGEAFTGES